jgi:hypothetical protein
MEWSIAYNNNHTEIIDAEEYSRLCDKLIREIEKMHPFIGDSRDYWVLGEAAESIQDVPGLVCEIGLRQGGGAKIILDALVHTVCPARTFISIDPYGAIEFEGMDGEVVPTTEYSNAMQKDTLEKMYRFVAKYTKINFIYLPLEDTEFFTRFADGVPVYNIDKDIMNRYALVHFDGPHTTEITMTETKFFMDKTPIGAFFVYDDVDHFYDHDKVKTFLEDNGWEQVHKTKVKASYKKVK